MWAQDEQNRGFVAGNSDVVRQHVLIGYRPGTEDFVLTEWFDSGGGNGGNGNGVTNGVENLDRITFRAVGGPCDGPLT